MAAYCRPAVLSGAAAALRRLRDAAWAVTAVKRAPEGSERPLTAPIWASERLDSEANMLASMEEAVELRRLACSPWWSAACEAGGYRMGDMRRSSSGFAA